MAETGSSQFATDSEPRGHKVESVVEWPLHASAPAAAASFQLARREGHAASGETRVPVGVLSRQCVRRGDFSVDGRDSGLLERRPRRR